MSASGDFAYFSGDNAETGSAIANRPTLPMNIAAINASFEIVDKCGVIPIESPTVPNADTLSNTTVSIRRIFPRADSAIRMTVVVTSTIKAALTKIAVAFTIEWGIIVRLRSTSIPPPSRNRSATSIRR